MPVKTISISQITNFVYNGIGKAESYFAKLLKSACFYSIYEYQSLNDKSCLEQLAAR